MIQNAVFNPRLYTLAGGTIEEFDPARESIKRAIARQKEREKRLLLAKRKRRAIKRRKRLLKSGLLLALWLFSVIMFIIGVHTGEPYVTCVALISSLIGLNLVE